MNCKNCGAPLILADGNDVWRCNYCETSKFAGELEQTEEGVTPLGESADINCPCCDVELQRALIDKTPIAYCQTCNGMLIHAPSMAVLVRDKRSAYRGPDDDPTLIDTAALNIKRDCPVCHEQLETYPYYGPGNCVIDSCRKCELVWLDKGELSKIIRAPGQRHGVEDNAPIPPQSTAPKTQKKKSSFFSFDTYDHDDSGSFFDLSDAFGDFFGD